MPDPAVLAREIVESLETALEQFRGIEDELEKANDAKLPASMLLYPGFLAREAVERRRPGLGHEPTWARAGGHRRELPESDAHEIAACREAGPTRNPG